MQRAKLFGALFAYVNKFKIKSDSHETWKCADPMAVRQIRWFPYIAPSVVERLQAILSMPLNDRGILD
jgi:hypothetical protein